MFNIALLNSSVFAITLFTVDTVSQTYAKYSYVHYLTKQYMYSDLMYFFTVKNIAGYIKIILAAFTILLNVCMGSYRINL